MTTQANSDLLFMTTDGTSPKRPSQSNRQAALSERMPWPLVPTRPAPASGSHWSVKSGLGKKGALGSEGDGRQYCLARFLPRLEGAKDCSPRWSKAEPWGYDRQTVISPVRGDGIPQNQPARFSRPHRGLNGFITPVTHGSALLHRGLYAGASFGGSLGNETKEARIVPNSIGAAGPPGAHKQRSPGLITEFLLS